MECEFRTKDFSVIRPEHALKLIRAGREICGYVEGVR